MSQFKPQIEILQPPQQQLWRELKPSVRLGLVLYGGTAIGLRLGHRPSVDFDFFTDKPLQRATLEEAFLFLKQSIVLQQQPYTLTVLVSDLEADRPRASEQSVKLSFFGNLDFGRINKPARGLAGASQMYKGAFQPSESLKALVYFEGGDLDLLTKRERAVLIGAARKVRDLPSVSWISELAIAENAH